MTPGTWMRCVTRSSKRSSKPPSRPPVASLANAPRSARQSFSSPRRASISCRTSLTASGVAVLMQSLVPLVGESGATGGVPRGDLLWLLPLAASAVACPVVAGAVEGGIEGAATSVLVASAAACSDSVVPAPLSSGCCPDDPKSAWQELDRDRPTTGARDDLRRLSPARSELATSFAVDEAVGVVKSLPALRWDAVALLTGEEEDEGEEVPSPD